MSTETFIFGDLVPLYEIFELTLTVLLADPASILWQGMKRPVGTD